MKRILVTVKRSGDCETPEAVQQRVNRFNDETAKSDRINFLICFQFFLIGDGHILMRKTLNKVAVELALTNTFFSEFLQTSRS
jgi:hypothetical protein